VDPNTCLHLIEDGRCVFCGIRVDVECPNPECLNPQVKDMACFNCGLVFGFESALAEDSDDDDEMDR
jgi:hypothetical protein